MSAFTDPEFQRELLDLTAKENGEKDYAVTSKVEYLQDGAAFTLSLKLEDWSGEKIYSDLIEYSMRYNTPAVLELLVTLPEGFPATPPVFRLLHPVLIHGTGGVINGNFVLPTLFPEGWSPDFSLHMIIDQVKAALINNGARIDVSSYSYYNYQAFKASANRLALRPDAALQHPQPFNKEYIVYSSNFAQEVMGLEIPFGFHAGNKVLMPAVALHEMTTSREQASRAAGRLVRQDSHLFEGALVFQLTPVLQFPTFVGVHSFTCPHPDIIIVPPQVLSNMFVPEGSKVALSRVQLPDIESVVVQPHTINFIASEEFTGKPPKEFLEASLVRYSTLQAGDVIVCDGGKEADDMLQSLEFAFNVVSVKPEGCQAAALWGGFAAHVPISFLPAMDEFAVPPKRSTVPATAAEQVNTTVGQLRPEVAAQMFGEAGAFSAPSPPRAGPTAATGATLAPFEPPAATTSTLSTSMAGEQPPAINQPAIAVSRGVDGTIPPTSGADGTQTTAASTTATAAETTDVAPEVQQPTLEERRRRAAEAAAKRRAAAAASATAE